MATGYLGCALAILRGSIVVDALVALYAIGLVLVYAVTRGLATKAAEIGLAVIASPLFVGAARTAR